MFRGHLVLIYISIFILFCSTAAAESPASLIDSGNKSWTAGDYEGALKKYNEATVDDPESPYIYFNKGTAFYKKGNYSDAVNAFEKAALKSKDPEMESKSRYNLGNCAFREAERQMDSDLKKSLDYCEKSIKHFHDALKLDPGLKEAAENIEIVRLVMKNILDEIKKREQEAKEKEQAARETAEKIQELIKRQEEALEKNRQTSGNNLEPDEYKQELAKLADEQNDITGDTRDLTEKIRQQSQSSQGGEAPAIKHLDNALKEQASAERNLRNSESNNAQKNQDNAIKELKQVLKPPDQDKQDQKDQQNQPDQQNQGENREQSAENEPAEQEQAKEQEQAALQKANEDAQDILDEEKENKERRRIMPAGGYSEVEKDW